MRSWSVIIVLAIGLALVTVPVVHALALQGGCAGEMQVDQHSDQAAPAAASICCPVPNLPTAATVAYRISIVAVAWSRLSAVEQGEWSRVPEPRPPEL